MSENSVALYVQEQLFLLKDEKFKEFNSKLIPNVNSSAFIGVKTPAIRKFASAFSKQPECLSFLKILPHDYFEEYAVHSALIASMKDFSQALQALEEFLPFIDNWAICDMLKPKIFKKNLDKLLPSIKKWLLSSETYTVRFGIGMLMSFYLDEHFSEEYLELVACVNSEEYYVKMMQAWYFATALAKQWEKTVTYIEEKRLVPWTHNKTIQKAVESFRITDEQKKYLRTLKLMDDLK
ncbi:MAG: DNA alkylation repair protein [Spirochaetia bacterium]|nr:DNA alkylation repair protein [Spirochaetia bacterium]